MSSFFKKIGGGFCRFFGDLRPLVMMQLKEKIDVSFLKTFKSAVTKIVFSILGFAAVTAVCYGFFAVAKMLRLFSLAGFIPVTVLAIVFTFMFLLSTVSCTVGLTKTLYFSRDNHVLLTMPVPTAMVYVSKLVVFYLYELVRNFSFIIPLFLAYGLVSNVPVLYYPWVLFASTLVTALPVLAGALLSIPSMWVYQFLRQHRAIQLLLYAVAIGGLTYLAAKLIGLIPEDLRLIAEWAKVSANIQSYLRMFEEKVPIFYLLTLLIAGKQINLVYKVWTSVTLPAFGVLVGAILVLFALGDLVARPLFFHMASKPFEYRKRNVVKAFRNRPFRPWLSAFGKELKLAFRTPTELYTIVVELFGLPLMILLLNKLYNSMDTRRFGDYMIFAFNLLLMLLFMTSANVEISSVYSREGRASYMPKTQPVSYFPLLLSKLYTRIIVSGATAAAVAVVFYKTANVMEGRLAEAILLGGLLFCLSTAHIFWCAEMDIMNPQSEHYGAMGEHSRNPNETKATVLAFLLSVLVAVAFFLLTRENDVTSWVKVFGFALFLCLFKIGTYLWKVQVYYKEK